MVRLGSLLSLCLAGTMLAAPALAADYTDYPQMRSGLPLDFDNNQGPSPISFEAGLRYFYSVARQDMSAGGGDYGASDRSHSLEAYGRINDNSSNTYLKGNVGFSAIMTGNYNNPTSGGVQPLPGGHIGYATADFGYLPLGTDMFRFGGFVGYNYRNESPDMEGAGTDLNLHSLRLGVAGRLKLADIFTVDAEAAIVPYSYLYGSYGTYNNDAGATIEGQLYGAQGQIMLSAKPYGNMVVGVGARASYLQGSGVVGGDSTTNLAFARYGLIGELGGEF